MLTFPRSQQITTARLTGIAILSLTLPALCHAQALPARPPETAPATLKTALPLVHWNLQEQGPLLIVAPEETRPRQRQTRRGWQTVSEPAVPLPAPSDGTYRLGDLTDVFGRRIVRCGSVSVFAPTTMAVLNIKNLPEPTPFLGLGPQDALRGLMASLTPAQQEEVQRQSTLGEWLRPDATSAKARAEEIVKVARVPGLAGIAVKNVTPPGYDFQPLALGWYGAGQIEGGDLGYTEAERLAFLRETEVDPVDISMSGDQPAATGEQGWARLPNEGIGLPFFASLPQSGNRSGNGVSYPTGAKVDPALATTTPQVYEAWIARRAQWSFDASAKLLQTVQEQVTDLPVFFTDSSDVPTTDTQGGNVWYERIEHAPKPLGDKPPFSLAGTASPKKEDARKSLHRRSQQVLSGAEWFSDDTSPDGINFNDDAARQVLKEAAKTSDGLIVDFTRLSLPAALTHLKRWHLAASPAPDKPNAPGKAAAVPSP